MNREQLEHLIRAAGAIAQDDQIVVIGSQAILGAFPDAPEALLVSMEADVFPRNHPERWDLVDGSIGEGSPFHETFGYYAQGVGPETATLPDGWEHRLVPVFGPSTAGVTGWCLETHDILVSKAFAGRPKDLDFLRVAFAERLAHLGTCLERADQTGAAARAVDAAKARLRAAARPSS